MLCVVSAILAALVAAGCTTAQPATVPTPDLSDVTLIIQSPTDAVAAADSQELQAAVPFDIVFPNHTFLPTGTELTTVHVSLPPEQVGEDAYPKHIKVILLYGGPDSALTFRLEESLIGYSIGGLGPGKTLGANISPERHVEIEYFEDPVRRISAATWRGYGIGFQVSGSPDRGLTERFVPRLVGFTVEQCE